MPINLEKVVGADLGTLETEWGQDDIILYNLGLGAGVTDDPAELRYVYEKDLVALPTYAVIAGAGVLSGLDAVPGFEVNHALLLHGEQAISVNGPIPTAARAAVTGRVAGVYDKGHAALVVLETEGHDDTGRLLFTNQYSLFFRGEGGFGGDSGPKAGAAAPERTADKVLEVSTFHQQAAIYRLSGDTNPLHIDPEYAKLGGFDRPILHGLCTFGVVCKAVIDSVLSGDIEAVRGYRTRFAGVVYPGETLVIETWDEPDRIALRVTSKERGTPVLTHAAVTR